MSDILTDNKNVILEPADRYPGMRPFSKAEKDLFFGRATEIEELVHSVRVHQFFVLYGKSGLGKSSVINAGLVPRLEAEDFYVVNIRFQDSSTDPRDILVNEINNNLPAGFASPLPTFEVIGNLFANLTDDGITPLLIFDQFEEFFYYPLETKRTFLTAINSICNPKNKKQQTQTAKILFAIRADRLSLLEEVAVFIPTILANRYELKPLNIDKAEQAVVLPAQIPANVKLFKTEAFDYSNEALAIILKKISDAQKEVDSTQLQIVCQELERLAKEIYLKEKRVIINPADFKGEQGLQDVVNKFYQKQLNLLQQDKYLGLSASDTLVIRKLIEDDLLSDGKRIGQSEGKVMERLSEIPSVQNNEEKQKAVIKELLNCRLIRAEDTHLGRVYEISHDTLVASIRNAGQERQNQLQAKKRRNTIMMFCGILTIIVVFFYWLYTNKIQEQNKFKKVDYSNQMIEAKKSDNNKLRALFYLSEALNAGKSKDTGLMNNNKDLLPLYVLKHIYFIKGGLDNGLLSNDGKQIYYVPSGTGKWATLDTTNPTKIIISKDSSLSPQTNDSANQQMIYTLLQSWGIHTTNDSLFGTATILTDDYGLSISKPALPNNILTIFNYTVNSGHTAILTWGLNTDSLPSCNIWKKENGKFYSQAGSALPHFPNIEAAAFRYNDAQLVTWDDSTIRIWQRIDDTGIDADIPPDLLKLEVQLITGAQYNTGDSNHINVLKQEEWEKLLEEFKTIGAAHYKECLYKNNNLYKIYFP